MLKWLMINAKSGKHGNWHADCSKLHCPEALQLIQIKQKEFLVGWVLCVPKTIF
jgi:hypothetical protein